MLLKHFVSDEVQAQVEEKLVKGGIGYGDLKKQLFEAVMTYFADARARREVLAKKPDYVTEVLIESGKKARALAQKKMEEVRLKVGLR